MKPPAHMSCYINQPFSDGGQEETCTPGITARELLIPEYISKRDEAEPEIGTVLEVMGHFFVYLKQFLHPETVSKGS